MSLIKYCPVFAVLRWDQFQQFPLGRKARTCNPGRRAGQGRPLGFLRAWLARASSHACFDQLSHKDTGEASVFSTEERRAARHSMDGLEGAEVLKRMERPPSEGEDSEPEACP